MQHCKSMNSSKIKKTELDQLMPLIREGLSAGKSVRFSPSGTSMLPMLREGIDSVVLSPVLKKLKKYDVVLYRRDNGQYILHRIIKVEHTYTCVGDNQFYQEKDLHHDQMIAVVTSFYRNKKEIQASNFLYRFYYHFWHYIRPVLHLFKRCINWLRRHL